jgi:hypothetical protein
MRMADFITRSLLAKDTSNQLTQLMIRAPRVKMRVDIRRGVEGGWECLIIIGRQMSMTGEGSRGKRSMVAVVIATIRQGIIG